MHHLRNVLVAVLLLATTTLWGADERAKPPDAAEQAKAEKLIKDVFKEEYAKKSPEGMLALAAHLLEQGVETRDDPPGQFVLFREARDLAAQGGDPALALQVIDTMGKTFQINQAAMKVGVFEIAGQKAATLDAQKDVIAGALQVLDEALQEDDFDSAQKLIATAEGAAKKSRSFPLIGSVQNRGRELVKMKAEFDKLKPATAALASNPKDADASLAVGRYAAFVKADWKKGLPLLAQGSDAKLKAAALKDQAGPVTPAEQIEAGDGWWDLAATQDLGRWQIQRRAYEWYKAALPNLTGLARTKVEKRMAELEVQAVQAGRKTDEGTGWLVLLRSDDPSIWKKDFNKGADHFARSHDKLVADKVKYLKITNVKSKDFVIIEMTKEKLTQLFDDGRYGWEGENHTDSGAYHLGIFDTKMDAGDQGRICIRVLPWYAGWGFGHIAFVNDTQGYCWDGKSIPKTVFEIAVGPGPLSVLETKKLLKK